MSKLIQPSLGAGELAPALHGRVDTAKYQVGLKTARNVIIHPFGGASNRPGLIFTGPVKDHTKSVRLIRFQFKTTDTYVLELGDLYMRVIRNGAHVVNSSTTISGATQANPVVITDTAHPYSNDDEVSISGVLGMTELNGKRYKIANKGTNTYELTDQVTGDNIDGTAFTAYSSAGISEQIFELITPYSQTEIFDIKFTQSADVMTLTHDNHDARELSRTNHNAWTLSTITFAPATSFPVGLAVTVNTAGSETVRYAVTAVDEDTGEESLPGVHTAAAATISGATAANPVVITATGHTHADGDTVDIKDVVGMTELNGRRFVVDNSATNSFELRGEDGTSFTTYSSAGTATMAAIDAVSSSATEDNDLTWTAVSGASAYNIYKEENGTFGLIGSSATNAFTDSNITVDLDNGPPTLRNPFFGANNKPGAVGFYQQRRLFGGTVNKPDTWFATQTGFFDNMTKSSPSQLDDAITATLSAQQVNEIRHFVSLNDLVILTSGSEWRVNSGADTAFASTTIKQRPQTYWGVSQVPPIVIGQSALFIQERGSYVRSLGYSLGDDAYVGTNLTTFARHLFLGHTILDWTFAQIPDGLVFAVRDDGELLSLTFDQEQEVIAWSHWDTDGKFESCTTVPDTTNNEDQSYFVVKRTINGNTVRYIERTHTRQFENVKDCFFVDSGLSLDVPVTISGSTAANPVVITATSHGFSNEDLVDIDDIVWAPTKDNFGNAPQPAQLNGGRFTVKNKTTHTFEIYRNGSLEDGSLFNAYVSGGTVRKAVTNISGLEHLEGEAVAVLADGNVIADLTVANGAITLATAASRIHIGLEYVADVETLQIESPEGTIQGKQKRIPYAHVRFDKSRGLIFGPDKDNLEEMKQRQFESYGTPTGLLTDAAKIIFSGKWNKIGIIFLRQKFPLPMTILSVIPTIITENRT